MWFAVLLAMLALSGCSLERDRSFKAAEDWSRGNKLGFATVRQPVGLAADEQGAYLLWGQRGEETTQLNFVRLDPDGTQATSSLLPLRTLFPRQPQVVPAEQLHAFFLTRFAASEPDGIYHLQLNRNGGMLGDPVRLSGPEQKTDQYAVSRGPDGTIHLLWDVVEGPSTGIYYLRLLPDGTPDGFPQLVEPGGRQPAAQMDADGTLHAVWLVETASGVFDLRYATVAPGAGTISAPAVVAKPRISSSDVASPLTLALDETNVYALWSQEHRTGLQGGASELFYVAFPRGAPTLQTPATLHVSGDPSVTYEPNEQAPPLTALVPPDQSDAWTEFIESPSALPLAGGSAALVLADMNQEYRLDTRPQVALFALRDGEFEGYQLPARTEQYSLLPRGAVSEDGHLHLVWLDLEGPGNYGVYYASTRPEAHAVLDQRTAADTRVGAVEVAWGMLSGLSLLPLFAIVLLPVLVANGLFYVTGNDDSLRTSWAAKLTLVVSIVLYLGAKMLLMAGVITRPPFMNSVPPALRVAWVWIAVLLVALIAGLALWIYVRRSDRPELLRGVLVFTLTDVLLTLLLYGPSFYSD